MQQVGAEAQGGGLLVHSFTVFKSRLEVEFRCFACQPRYVSPGS